MSEIRLRYEHYAVVEIDSYQTSAGASGYRARMGKTTTIGATLHDALTALASELAKSAVTEPDAPGVADASVSGSVTASESQ